MKDAKRWEREPNYLEKFCCAFLKRYNVLDAARATNTPSATAYSYMKHPDVKAKLAEMTEAKLAAQNITVDRILEELASIAFLDVADIINSDGKVIDAGDMPEYARKAVTEIKVKSIGEFVIETTVKFASKERALELLGKWRQLAMFKDVVETEVVDRVAHVKTVELEERIKGLEVDREQAMRKPE